MHLANFSIRGFRSLAEVEDIPIGSPTILAGPNDGGKSSALDAVKFLLGRYSPIEDDRTYLEGESDGGRADIDVSGRFLLDEWEQEKFSLPAVIKLRRIMSRRTTPARSPSRSARTRTATTEPVPLTHPGWWRRC